MDSTTHIIVNQHQLTDETFEPKLKDVADQLFSNGLSQPTILSNLLNVVDACISTTHIAFLLDDGRVCRVSYNIQTDKIDTVNSNTTSSSSGGGTTSNTTATTTTTTTTSSNDTPKSKTKIQNTNTILPISGGGISASVASAIGSINSVTQNASTTSATSGSGTTTSQLNTTQFRPQSRAGFRSHETFIIPSAQEILAPISTHSFGRGRRGQLLRGRVSSLIVGSRIPPIVPASAVPESLIESVQTVLQSKSRNVIIRELQRTNLDVNLAVNNLLQRDDEGDDGGDDDDPYLHGGDDLISLLDINSHAGDHSVIIDSDGTVFDEDTFRITRRLSRNISSHAAAAAAAAAAASGTGSTTASSGTGGTTDTSTSGSGERDRKSYRLRDQRWYDTTSSSSSSSYRDEMFQSRLERDTTTTNATNTTTSTSSTQQQQQNTSSTGSSSQIMSKLDEMLKKGASTQNPISFGENLQYWTEKNGETPVFIKIASLYSELVAISKTGQLYQWKWSCDQPYSNQDNPNQHHPKSLYLNILNERVLGVSTSTVRASIYTESGKIATWLDESVDITCTNKFQMTAQQLFDPTTDSILQMSVSNIYTVIRMASGSLYWWGIMPFEHRAKLIEKYQSKAHKMKLSLANEIVVGSYVCLKTLPLYSSGTIAVTIKDGQPKIGQLVEHMFSFRDSKLIKFKLRTADSFKDSVDSASVSSKTPTSVEMPPPSTTETLTSSNTLKRKKLSSESESSSDRSKQQSQTYNEESWPLSDVIFVDDSKTYSLGKVIKIDADYVIVKMQSKSSMSDSLIDTPTTSTTTSLSQTIESQTLLDNCRIFPKSQLQTFKAASSLRLPDFMQKSPKRLTDIGSVIAFTAQNNGLHAITIKENTMFYIFYDIITNKVIREKRFPTRIQAFGPNMNNIVLQALDDPQFNYLTFIDGNSTLYPLLDINSASNNTIKDPLWKNLFPIKYFTQSVLQVKTGADTFKKLYITMFSMKIENLITNILRYDVEKVNMLLKLIEIEYRNDPTRLKTILSERIDGNRNILHAAVFACAPTTNNDSNSANTSSSVGFQIPLKTLERSWSSSSKSDPLRKVNVGLDSILITPNSLNSAAIVPGSSDTNSSISDHSYGGSTRATPGGGGDTSSNDDLTASMWPPIIEQMQMDSSKSLLPSTLSKETLVYPPVRLDEKEKKMNSIKILQILLESPVLKEHLIELLSYKNAESATPFMYAVNIRAYNAALLLLESAISIRKEAYSQNKDGNSIFYNMIFPIGSNVDNSPLYVLCCNDTCSFTWTGDNHITQDIFECRTCTLVGNLCCCTECARTCHKGHDCKIKTSSPTAYCDCWEKCKCKSLIAGDQEKRFDLLCKLLNDTNLLQLPNSRGENLLLFLAQTVGRQILEQKNYKRSSVLNRKSHQIDSDMPQHDLEPPHFSRRAFDHILSNWSAVKEMMLFNYKQNIHLSQLTLDTYDDSVYLDNQNGCIDLDKFTYTLIVKCPSEMLNALLSTLSKETEINNDSIHIIKRFLRSVARLYVVLIMESVPTPTNVFSQSSYQTSKYRKNTFLPTNTPISKCESVFKQFPVMCVEELINIAQSLISPVLLGNSKPTIFKPLLQEDTRIDKQNYVLADDLFNIESPMQRQFSMSQAYNQMQQARIETTVTAIPPPQPSTSAAVVPPPPPPAPSSTTTSTAAVTRTSTRRRHDSPNLSNTSGTSSNTTAATVANEQPSTSSNYSISMLTAPSIRTQHQQDAVPPPPPTTQPPPPPPPPVTRSVSVVIPMDDDQQSDQISDNDDSEANTRDNFVLQEDMDLNLFAESDSDSDNSNNSNRDNASAAQRSAITAATVGTGSDPGGAYFSDNDSDVSSNQEEDEEDSDIRSDILTVDNDNSELFHLNSEQSSNEFYNRQVQWSLRRHNAGGSSTTGGGSGSGTTGADIARIHHTNTSAPPPSLTSTSASVAAAAAVAAAAQFNPTSSLYQDIHMRRAAASGAVSLSAVSQPPQQIPPQQQHTQSGQASLSSNLASSLHHTQHHHTAHHHLHSIHQQASETESIINTNNTLARGFSLILKLIRDLLNGLYQKDDKSFDLQNFNNLLEYINQKLEPTWKWLVLLLDSNESQLRFGCSLTASIADSNVTQYLKSLEDKAISNNSSKQHDINRRRHITSAQLISNINSSGVSSRTSANDAIHTRRDFMNYALSLMRFESNEHKETPPMIDMSLLKHVAYVFDGIMYYLRLPISEENNESIANQSTTAATTTTTGGATTSSNTVTMHHTSASMSSLYEAEEIESETEMETSIGASYQTDSASEEDDSFKSNACNRTNTFFKRSDSTLCLGGSSPDPFSLSLEDSLPLAAKPHLLQPHTRKQEMFKVQSNQVDQFNALNKLGGTNQADQRQQLPKLVLPLFKKSTTFASTKVASMAHSKSVPAHLSDTMTYDASSSIKTIINSFSRSNVSASSNTTDQAGMMSTSATNDLLDLSLNKAQTSSGSTTSQRASSFKKQMIQPTLVYECLNLPTNKNHTDQFFDRWRLTLDLFGRVFCDDVGLENGSIIRQLGGFQIKETRFRREMEKYRNSSNKELNIEVDRDRDSLIQTTFKALNNLYAKRTTSTSSSLPPLCLSRIKVTFKDEQGEGSGVARSFYTAFSEAILSTEKLPSLENVYSHSVSSTLNSYVSLNMLQRYRNTRDHRRRPRSRSREANERTLCTNAAPFYIPGSNTSTNADFTLYESLSATYKDIGEKLYNKIVLMHPSYAPKITGMLLDLKIQQLQVLLNSDNSLRAKVEEALSLIISANVANSAGGADAQTVSGSQTSSGGQSDSSTMPFLISSSTSDEDSAPLFWQADKKGFYSPRPGKNSAARLNAFRNVGRIIGICLLQNELLPIPLSRHIIKYILNRQIKWHDLAFFDSVMYESFRKMIYETEKNGDSVCKALDLTFNIDLCKDEDGTNYDLIENGSNIEVNKNNMYEFVKRYAEYRMVKRVEQCCSQLKLGIYDVLPANSLNGLNAEDFRLLLNGIVEINVQTLMSYTTINDESKEGAKRLQFEKWFWSTVEKMNNQEKQELLFFWTGSPYLPASDEGFQPLPSITIRPPSDQHLPTANTCINRLYIPLYSSKSILKSKLLYAIKTKSFGFV